MPIATARDRPRLVTTAITPRPIVSIVSGSRSNESTRYSPPCSQVSRALMPVASFAYAVFGNGKPK